MTHPETTHRDAYAPPPALPGPPPAHPAQQKTPVLAGLLSVVPGLGNIYNGLYLRGVSMFLIFVALFGLSVDSHRGRELAVLVPSMIFFWLFNLFDAYRQATLINYGYSGERENEAGFGAGELVPGIVLVLIGAYGALREYFDLDLTWLLHHWPIAVLVFGGWMIWEGLRRRQAAARTDIVEASSEAE